MREIYDMISSLPPEAYTVVAVLLGFLLIDNLTVVEQRSLGGFFVLIGETLWVNSSQTEVLINRRQSNKMTNMENDIEMLKRRTGMV